jgi:hypothetical protein
VLGVEVDAQVGGRAEAQGAQQAPGSGRHWGEVLLRGLLVEPGGRRVVRGVGNSSLLLVMKMMNRG